MWLDRNLQHETARPSYGSGAGLLSASYRRGLFRAKVNVRALSCTTAQVDCMENPPVGTMIWLTLPGLEARAAIVEDSGEFRVNLRLAEPLHPAVLDALLRGWLRTWH